MRIDRRKWRWPLWYYGLILLTAMSSAAGVYFRGAKVQGDVDSPRIIIGLLITALCAITAWAFRALLKEIRNIGARVGVFSEALLVILMREAREHPETAEEIDKLIRSMVREREKNRIYSD